MKFEKLKVESLRLTQHKRFVSYGSYPNNCFAKIFLCWEC